MMKMISSTNITSTKGVTLMSAIISPSESPPTLIAMKVGSWCWLASGSRCCRLADRRRTLLHAEAHLHTRDQIGVQFVGEMADSFLNRLVAAQKNVVAQHRGNG